MIDRYTKAVLTVIALTLLVIAVRPLVSARSAEAGWDVKAPDGVGTSLVVPNIPRAWGRLASAIPSPNNYVLLIFEAPTGEINWTAQPIMKKKVGRE